MGMIMVLPDETALGEYNTRVAPGLGTSQTMTLLLAALCPPAGGAGRHILGGARLQKFLESPLCPVCGWCVGVLSGHDYFALCCSRVSVVV